MKPKTIITVVLLAFVIVSVVHLVIKESRTSEQNTITEQTTQIPFASEKKVIAYYFHGNMRCMTCRKIEAYTKKAIQTGFPDALKNGRLELRIVNVDEPDNEHFVKDYQIVTRSVVIAEFEGSEQKRWKNLGQVWQLVGDEQAFLKYIQNETDRYLEGKTDG